MPSAASIIKSRNKNGFAKEGGQQGNVSKTCNCRKNNPCPMQGKCLTPSVIYKAEVKACDEDNSKLYIGLTELPFKSRYYSHQQSFRDAKQKYSTELFRHVWELKQKRKEPIITSINGKAHSYENGTKRYDLRLTEKLFIINSGKGRLLKRRSDLISKCRHQNEFNT